MKTTKPIATISYNSTEFLDLKLSDLISSKKIEYYCYIVHLGEDDESGKKDHIHLYVEPARLIQTTDLNDYLIELTHDIQKPLKCLPFKPSKFPDWYMYAIHDKSYLSSKGLVKKYFYRFEDFKTSEIDELRYKVKTIDLLELTPFNSIREAVNNGETFEEYLCKGRVPIHQLLHYEKAFRSISRIRHSKVLQDISHAGLLQDPRSEPGYYDPLTPDSECPF